MAQWWETPAPNTSLWPPPSAALPIDQGPPELWPSPPAPQDNPYLKSALSAYQQMREQSRLSLTPVTEAAPEPKPKPALSRTWGQAALDTGVGIVKGGLGLATGLANLVDLGTGGAVSGITRGVGGALNRVLGGPGEGYTMQESASRIDEGMAALESAPLQQKRQNLQAHLATVGTQGGIPGGLEKFWESAKGTLSDPALLGQMAAEQLPMLATLGAGTVGTAANATRAAQAVGPLLPEVAAQVGAKAAARANIGFSGALGAGFASQQAAQDVLRATPEQLASSPDYQALLQQGASDAQARATLARQASYPAAAIAGPISALTGRITAPLETAAFLGQLPGGVRSVLGAMGREVLEEIPQESSEQVGTNVGVQQAGIDRGLWEGVPEAAGAAGVMGLVMGGALGSIGHVNTRASSTHAAQDAGQQAIHQAERAQLALSGLDEAQLSAAAEQARTALAEQSRMPGRLRQQLQETLGRLDADLQGRANGERLREVLSDPAQLQTVRGQSTLAGMVDPARVGQLSDAELSTATDQAQTLATAPDVDAVQQQRWGEVAQAYQGHLQTRQQLAHLDEALAQDPHMAKALVAHIVKAVRGDRKAGITPEYARASLDDTELARQQAAGDRLLDRYASSLNTRQQKTLRQALEVLRTEQTQRQNPDWAANNAAIRQMDDPGAVRLRHILENRPEKTVRNLKAADVPLMERLIQSLEVQAQNYAKVGLSAPDSIQKPLALLKTRKAILDPAPMSDAAQTTESLANASTTPSPPVALAEESPAPPLLNPMAQSESVPLSSQPSTELPAASALSAQPPISESALSAQPPISESVADPAQGRMPLPSTGVRHARNSLLSGDAKPAGMPVARVQAIADEFLRGLNVSEKSNLEVRIRGTVRDFFGPGDHRLSGRVSGFFLPAIAGADPTTNRGRNTVGIVAGSFPAEAAGGRAEVEKTLRHEILAHYGINLLPADKKRALLDTLIASKNRPGLRQLALAVDRDYADQSEDMRAEELFARAAEELSDRTPSKAWDRVVSFLMAQLRQMGLVKGPVTRAEVNRLLRSIAESIRRGAQQRTFPAQRDAQFSRTPADTGDPSLAVSTDGPAQEVVSHAEPFPGERRNFHALEALEITNPAGNPQIHEASEPTPKRSDQPAGPTLSIAQLLNGAIRDGDGQPFAPTSTALGQAPGLFTKAPVTITSLTGEEFGKGIGKSDLAKAADALLRRLQSGPPLVNDDTGWDLVIGKQDRKKMGDNADQSAADSKAVAGLTDLVRHAIRTESHQDIEHRNPNVSAIHRLYAPVRIAEKLYRAKLTVKDYSTAFGRRNLHALEAIEIESAPSPGILPAGVPHAVPTQAQPTTTEHTLSIAQLLNGAIRDGDGQPFAPTLADAQTGPSQESSSTAATQAALGERLAPQDKPFDQTSEIAPAVNKAQAGDRTTIGYRDNSRPTRSGAGLTLRDLAERFKDTDPRASRPQQAARSPLSPTQARAQLAEALGERHVRALEQAGRLVIHAADPTKTGAAGFVDADGVMHLIPAHMDQDALSVALHEAMHMAKDTRFLDGDRAKLRLAHAGLRLFGLKNFIGNPSFTSLTQEAYRLAAAGNPIAQQALAKAQAEYAADPHTDVPQEMVAYLVQYADAQLPLVRRLLSAIRAALFRMGVKIQLSLADVRALAVSALKAQAKAAKQQVRGAAANPRAPAYSQPNLRDLTPDQQFEWAAAGLKIMVGNPDAFQYPRSNQTDMIGIAADLDPRLKVSAPDARHQNPLRAYRSFGQSWTVTMPDGASADVLTSKSGREVYIDASELEKGKSTGSLLYQLVGQWAYNNGKVFVGDPLGISPAGKARRLEHLISLALKFGTTDPFMPHPDQNIPWRVGDHGYNLAQMLKASSEFIQQAVPAIQEVRYEFGSGTGSGRFIDAATGRVLGGDAFKVFADSRGARVAQAGSRTLKRAVLVSSLVRRAGREGWRELLGQLVQLGSSAVSLDPALKRTFYSQPSTDLEAAEQARLWEEFQAVRAQFQNKQAHTTAFERWFGHGIEGITAKDGQPLTLYHGTPNRFYQFDAARAGVNSQHPTSGLGFFMTADPGVASRYGGNALELHAKITKPYYLTDADLMDVDSLAAAHRLRRSLQARGFDGAVLTGPGMAPYVIVFESQQAKLTSNQNPTDSPDFRYSMPAQSLRQRIESLAPVKIDFSLPETMPIAQARQQALAAAKRILLTDAKGEVAPRSFITKNGDEIWVSMGGLRAAISKHSGIQKMRVLPTLNQLIANSYFVLSEADLKAQERDSPNIKGYRYYVTKAELDGKPYYVKLAVREVEDRGIQRRFYDHELSEISEAARKQGTAHRAAAGNPTATASPEVSEVAGESGTFRIAAGHPPATTSLKAIIRHLFGESQAHNENESPQAKLVGPSQPASTRGVDPAKAQEGMATPEDQRRYSRPGRPAAWAKELPQEVRTMAEKIGAEPKPLTERMADWQGTLATRLRQGMVDRFARLADLDRQRFGVDFADTDTALSAWVAAKMSKSPDGALEAAFLHGELVWEDGALNVQQTGKGLAKALEAVANAGELNRFWQWIIAHRAERLKSEGREHLFTDAEIAAGKTLNQGVMADGKSRAGLYQQTFNRYRALQKSILDVAEQAGLFTAQQRAQWEHDFYLPFYRVVEDEGQTRGPSTGGQLVRQKAFQHLKGGTQPLGDPLQNILKNWFHLIDASLKNRAATLALDTATHLGVAQTVPEALTDKTSVWVMKDGRKVHYHVADPLTLEAISALHTPMPSGWMIKALAGAKRALTLGTTISPAFKARNLLRDSIAALAVSHLSPNALGNVVQGYRAAKEGSTTQAALLAGGGTFRFGTLLEGDRDAAAKRIAGFKPDTVLDSKEKIRGVLGLMSKGLDGWNRFGDRLETANRAALYQQRRTEGKTHLQAALAARDLLDFAQSGGWGATRFLITTVPFLNARIQGLDVLYRKGFKPLAKTVSGRGSTAERQQAARFALTTFLVSAASVLLYLIFKDDEDFKRREQWHRDTYWWFKIPGVQQPFSFPKPFEVGALGTIAERIAEQLCDPRAGGELFAERMKAMLTQTFAFDPMPQLFKPLQEIRENKSHFTQRPLETLDMERLSPERRYRAETSALAIGLSQAGLGRVGLSPVQIEHLIRGYFGWIGAQALLLGDWAVRPVLDWPEKPQTLKEAPIFGDLLNSFAPDGRGSRYVTEFYAQLQQLRQVHADARLLQKLGDPALTGFVQAHRQALGLAQPAERVARALAELGQAERYIANDRTLSGPKKQALIDRLRQRKALLARRVMERVAL